MKKSTTAKDWLEMDLKAQSGAIWTDEKSGMQKKKKIQNYENPKSPTSILLPDPVKYGGKEIPDIPQTID